MGNKQPIATAELPYDLGDAARSFKDYDFPFENLVLEGGGAKGIAYIGAMKVLEEAGIMPNIKRFAGTSTGAITAGLMAIGMSSEEIVKEMGEVDMENILLDSACCSCGCLKYICWAINFCKSYGAHSGDKFSAWYSDVINSHLQKHHAEKRLTGNITFNQLYNVFGIELCIVTCNTAYGHEMYYHVKTTPLATISQAVRQSMSIPGVFVPYQYTDSPDLYIDGGICANFPINCYDGWWLSMDEQDTFEKRLQEEPDKKKTTRHFYPEYNDTRFQPEGASEMQKKQRLERTLGLMMYTKVGRKAYQDKFVDRLEYLTEESIKANARPSETNLVRKFEKSEKDKKEYLEHYREERERKLTLMRKRLYDVLKQPRNREDMLNRFKELFGKDELKELNDGAEDHEVVFDILFAKYPGGEVTGDTIKNIYENWDPLENERQEAVPKQVIKSATELLSFCIDFVGTSKVIKEEDVERCIAIDVDYVNTMDFNMEPADKTFLMRQGAIATLAFLEEYVQKHGLQPHHD